MDKTEVYKIRAEDFAQNFMSLRTVEWQIIFQVYVGYGAIGIGYHALQKPYSPNVALGFGAIFATLVVFAVSAFVLYQIKDRLNWTRKMQNRYLAMLHAETSADALEVDGAGVRFEGCALAKAVGIESSPPPEAPKYQWRYAFVGEITISGLWTLGLIFYVSTTTWPG